MLIKQFDHADIKGKTTFKYLSFGKKVKDKKLQMNFFLILINKLIIKQD